MPAGLGKVTRNCTGAGGAVYPSASDKGLCSVLDELAGVVFSLDDVNGEALRVYSRLDMGELQYALALRDDAGRLRLAIWQRTAGIPIVDSISAEEQGIQSD